MRTVGYDGRGAVGAEWKEYKLAPNALWSQLIPAMEAQAVCRSDFRIAVSEKLVAYWRDNYGYDSGSHVVIPCTLGSQHQRPGFETTQSKTLRKKVGFGANDIIVCYSGSAAEWQSLQLLDTWLDPIMSADSRVTLLALSKTRLDDLSISRKYRARIRQLWVPAGDVAMYLSMADYGFLVRQNSTTNRVAAPTKFAEYLAAGLQVVVSPWVGDYSELVERESLGIVVSDLGAPITLRKTSDSERRRLKDFADAKLSKRAFLQQYQTVVGNLLA